MKGLGYRQRAILELLLSAGRAVPTGYLLRQSGADGKTAHMALLGLERRGLVRHVGFGKWESA